MFEYFQKYYKLLIKDNFSTLILVTVNYIFYFLKQNICPNILVTNLYKESILTTWGLKCLQSFNARVTITYKIWVYVSATLQNHKYYKTNSYFIEFNLIILGKCK